MVLQKRATLPLNLGHDPITTLLNAGVDMTSPQVIENFVEEYVSLVNEMELLLNKQQTVHIIYIFLWSTNVFILSITIFLSCIKKKKVAVGCKKNMDTTAITSTST